MNFVRKKELHDLLIKHQDRLCPIYFEALSYDATKELDHKPTIWHLKENIWEKLLKRVEEQTGNKDLNTAYEKMLNTPKQALSVIIMDELK